jgi:hypothetical protein
MSWPNRPRAFFVGFDQWIAAIITGWPDATLSAWAWAWERDGKCRWLRPVIDAIFFWDKDHCRESYRNELEGNQLPPELKIALEGCGGVKHDQGKLRLDLITPEMHRALGEVLTFGSKKYGDRNWEAGIDQDRLHAACQRHLLAWREGSEGTDPESGLPHLYHAFCTLGMMLTLEKRCISRENKPE